MLSPFLGPRVVIMSCTSRPSALFQAHNAADLILVHAAQKASADGSRSKWRNLAIAVALFAVGAVATGALSPFKFLTQCASSKFPGIPTAACR